MYVMGVYLYHRQRHTSAERKDYMFTVLAYHDDDESMRDTGVNAENEKDLHNRLKKAGFKERDGVYIDKLGQHFVVREVW